MTRIALEHLRCCLLPTLQSSSIPPARCFDSGAVGVFKIPAARQRVVRLGGATLQEIKFRPVNLWPQKSDQKHGLPLRQIAWSVTRTIDLGMGLKVFCNPAFQ